MVLKTRKITFSLNKIKSNFEVEYILNRERNIGTFDFSLNVAL